MEYRRNVFILMCLLAVSSVYSQSNTKRLALVIGNATYQGGSTLKNPVNDADLMASTLGDLGFEVIKETDATLIDMRNAFRNFANKIKHYDVALFFFAGHGMQIDGENYLIPVDAKLDDKYSIEYETLKVSSVNRIFSMNSENLNIMILDACRNNPYRSWMRGTGGGFTAIREQGAGTIIAFATREGETASDGIGNNGLFTEKLVEQMYIPQNITEVFQNTRIGVISESNKKQVPQEWNMLTGNFYFIKNGVSTNKGVVYSSEKKKPKPDVEYLGTNEANFEAGISSLIDNRDGKKYQTIGFITIDDQGQNTPMVWMTENIGYNMNDSYEIPGTTERLYTWDAALSACPEDWHLSSDKEWQLLVRKFGGNAYAGHVLKSKYGWENKSWNENGNGNNSSRFNALPLGYRNDFGTFTSMGKGGFYWTSTGKDQQNALKRTLYYNDNEVESGSASKYSAYSCRCIKN